MNTRSPMRDSPMALILGGIAAGFLCGLLGSGGGIVIVWVLGKVLGDRADSKDIFACALSVMLPIAAISTIGYAVGGELPTADALPILLPAILGGLGGGFLLDRLKPEAVRLLFAAIMTVSGILMVVAK